MASNESPIERQRQERIRAGRACAGPCWCEFDLDEDLLATEARDKRPMIVMQFGTYGAHTRAFCAGACALAYMLTLQTLDQEAANGATVEAFLEATDRSVVVTRRLLGSTFN